MDDLLDITGTGTSVYGNYELLFNYRIEENTEFNNSIWFFGCSHVYGYGLPENQTAPKILEELLGQKVINLGVPKSGVDFTLENLSRLLKTYKPKAVVIAYSALGRKMFITEQGLILFTPMHLGKTVPPNYDQDRIKFKHEFQKYLFLTKADKIIPKNISNINSIRAMLGENSIPIVEFTYVSQPELPKIHSFNGSHGWLDLAQDNLHPGFKTQTAVAEWVRDQMNSKKS
jgi:hypothetical protein